MWANGGGATFNGDANKDGVLDGLAWLLGATGPQANASALAPANGSINNSSFTLNFKLLKLSKRGTAVLKLQYSKDLGVTDPWTSHTITVPDSTGNVGGVDFVITPITATDLTAIAIHPPVHFTG